MPDKAQTDVLGFESGNITTEDVTRQQPIQRTVFVFLMQRRLPFALLTCQASVTICHFFVGVLHGPVMQV